MALTINSEKEFERNRERYEFLKWGQVNLRQVPRQCLRRRGIVHQVNLEWVATVAHHTEADGTRTLLPGQPRRNGFAHPR